MEINIYCVGKIKEEYLRSGIKEYIKRLSAYVKVNIIEVDDEKFPETSREKEIEKIKNNEGKRLLKVIPSKMLLIGLDLNRKEYDSVSFSTFINKKLEEGQARIGFVIGGSYGLSDEIKARCNDFITLSKMTFTHQMTRLIILEQIYRAFKIMKNEVYHK